MAGHYGAFPPFLTDMRILIRPPRALNASGDRDRQALLAEARSLSEDMGVHGLVGRVDELVP